MFKRIRKKLNIFFNKNFKINNEEYENNMIYLIDNYENIYYNKRGREKAKKAL